MNELSAYLPEANDTELAPTWGMIKMTQLAERLSACIAGRYSYGELAKLTGIPKSALQRYATGETEKIPLDRLETLARALGVSPQWLMDLPSDGSEAPRPVSPILPVYDALNDAGKKELCRYGRYLAGQEEFRAAEGEAPVVYIRHYLVPAAAGYASPVEGEDYEEIPLPKDAPEGADYCVTVRGDSMEPYIHDGQLVFVRRAAELREFEAGIFFVDGDVYCKQWCPGYAGEFYLLSANPAREDANITIWRDGGRSCVYFGKVLMKQRLPAPRYY